MHQETIDAIREYAKVKHAFVGGQPHDRRTAEMHLARAILSLIEQRAPASETGDQHPHEAAQHLSSTPRRERTGLAIESQPTTPRVLGT